MQGTLLQVALHETLTKSDDSHIVHCYGACDDFVMEEKHIYLEYVDGSDLFELASKFFFNVYNQRKKLRRSRRSVCRRLHLYPFVFQ